MKCSQNVLKTFSERTLFFAHYVYIRVCRNKGEVDKIYPHVDTIELFPNEGVNGVDDENQLLFAREQRYYTFVP